MFKIDNAASSGSYGNSSNMLASFLPPVVAAHGKRLVRTLHISGSNWL